MSTTTNTPRTIGLRWAEIADAQAAYDTLANNPTWEPDPSNVHAELTAAYELARLYDALSTKMAGPLATAVRHARQYLDHQITELEDAIDEDGEAG